MRAGPVRGERQVERLPATAQLPQPCPQAQEQALDVTCAVLGQVDAYGHDIVAPLRRRVREQPTLQLVRERRLAYAADPVQRQDVAASLRPVHHRRYLGLVQRPAQARDRPLEGGHLVDPVGEDLLRRHGGRQAAHERGSKVHPCHSASFFAPPGRVSDSHRVRSIRLEILSVSRAATQEASLTGGNAAGGTDTVRRASGPPGVAGPRQDGLTATARSRAAVLRATGR